MSNTLLTIIITYAVISGTLTIVFLTSLFLDDIREYLKVKKRHLFIDIWCKQSNLNLLGKIVTTLLLVIFVPIYCLVVVSLYLFLK